MIANVNGIELPITCRKTGYIFNSPTIFFLYCTLTQPLLVKGKIYPIGRTFKTIVFKGQFFTVYSDERKLFAFDLSDFVTPCTAKRAEVDK